MKKLLTLLLLCLVVATPAHASAWAWDDPEDDWDARILQALDDPAICAMVLTELDAWTEDEMWGVVDTVDIPQVSQATRAAIRDMLAIDNRIPDSRFTHMPHESEGWIIHLIVDACIIAILILIGYVAPQISAWLAAQKATTAATTTMDEFWELVRAREILLRARRCWWCNPPPSL